MDSSISTKLVISTSHKRHRDAEEPTSSKAQSKRVKVRRPGADPHPLPDHSTFSLLNLLTTKQVDLP